MLRGVLMGLLILIVAVFVYVGYSGYATGRSTARGDAYVDGMRGGQAKTGTRAEPMGSSAASTSLPAMPTTGDADGASNGMVAQGGGSAAAGMTPPASDSIRPNPPNGMTFGGAGHYQLYRQGDLTWRLNTDTGETCVIFATDEEWRRPKVYKAGCRAR